MFLLGGMGAMHWSHQVISVGYDPLSRQLEIDVFRYSLPDVSPYELPYLS